MGSCVEQPNLDAPFELQQRAQLIANGNLQMLPRYQNFFRLPTRALRNGWGRARRQAFQGLKNITAGRLFQGIFSAIPCHRNLTGNALRHRAAGKKPDAAACRSQPVNGCRRFAATLPQAVYVLPG